MSEAPSRDLPPVNIDLKSRAGAWTSYWQSGALHSCGGSFSGNYGGSLRQFWLQQFDRLQPPARVVDLCCGNAPLSLLLISERPERLGEGQIDAVDLARIDPPWLAGLAASQRPRVKVRSAVSAAELPLEDASVDLLMSQYGIEYVGVPAVVEASRVLRPGGVLAAVVHHVDALPVQIARAELIHCQTVEDLQLISLTEQMFEPMARSASDEGRRQLAQDAGALRIRQAFNAALQNLTQAIEQANYPDLLHEVRDGLMHSLQLAQSGGVLAGSGALADLVASLGDSRLRQAELVDHAMTREGLGGWFDVFAGGEMATATLDLRPGSLAGWAVTLTRSAG